MMAIYKENAKNEQYVFQYRRGHLSEVITYRKHLIHIQRWNTTVPVLP